MRAPTPDAGNAAAARAEELCGWQEEPSVPPATLAASAKLARACLRAAGQHPPAALHLLGKCGSIRQDGSRPAAAWPPAGSPRSVVSELNRREGRGAAAAASADAQQRRVARQTPQQQQQQRWRQQQTLQPLTGEEDSVGASLHEHFSPERAAAGATGAAGEGLSPNATPQRQLLSSTAQLHLPPLEGLGNGDSSSSATLQEAAVAGAQQHAACETGAGSSCRTPGAAVKALQVQPGTGDVSAMADRAGGQPQQQEQQQAGLAPPQVPRWNSSSDAHVLALQQRLLLHSSSWAGSSLQPGSCALPLMHKAAAAPPGALERLCSGRWGQAAAAAGAGGGGGHQAGAVATASSLSCLHTRMAATAARAQLLLVKDLAPPPVSRPRSAARQQPALAALPVLVSTEGPQEQQQQPGAQPSGPSATTGVHLRSISKSRPASGSSRCCGETAGDQVPRGASAAQQMRARRPASAAPAAGHGRGGSAGGGTTSAGLPGGAHATVAELLQRLNRDRDRSSAFPAAQTCSRTQG